MRFCVCSSGNRSLGSMFSLLPGVPGDLRGLIRTGGRRIDTVRHHGVPKGAVLEWDVQSAPPGPHLMPPGPTPLASGMPLGEKKFRAPDVGSSKSPLRSIVAAMRLIADGRLGRAY